MMIRDGFDPKKVDWFVRARYRRQLAMEYIRKYPIEYTQAYLRGILNTFASLGTQPYGLLLGWRESSYRSNVLDANGIVATINRFITNKSKREIFVGGGIAFYLLVFYGNLTVGFVVLWRAQRSALLFLFCMAFYYILLAGPAGEMRLKVPALPFFLPIVAVGANHIISKRFRTITLSHSSPFWQEFQEPHSSHSIVKIKRLFHRYRGFSLIISSLISPWAFPYSQFLVDAEPETKITLPLAPFSFRNQWNSMIWFAVLNVDQTGNAKWILPRTPSSAGFCWGSSKRSSLSAAESTIQWRRAAV